MSVFIRSFLFLLCLVAPFSSHAASTTEGAFTFSADDFNYNSKNNTLTASGKVELVSPETSIWADEVVYNQETGEIIAQGHVAYADKNGFMVFLNRLELNSKLSTGSLDSLKARLGENGPALTAQSATRPNSSTIIMNNAAYSPCQACKNSKTLAWQIRAKKIIYDQETQQITYNNATLDAYGTPIFYLPWFKHPVGRQNPTSGFLPPRFGRSTTRGEELTTAYYYRPSDQSDYTFRTRFMTRRGVQFIAENRHISENSTGEFRASAIADDKTSDLRSHLEGSAEYAFKEGRRMGINGALASDDTYLDAFFGRNPSYLPSTAYVEGASESHYAAVYGTYYQDLEADHDPATTAQILPRVQLEKMFELNDNGSQFTISGDILALHRDEGRRSRRMVAQAEYAKPYFGKFGDHFTLRARLRGDLYHVDNDTSDDEVIARGLPELVADWERPMVSKTGFHRATPRVMAVLSPIGGNPTDIPNEDSVAYELDTSNLFSSNRFAGLDRVETGHRIIYGLDNTWGHGLEDKLRLFFGQSIRLNNDTTLPQTGGTGTKMSDWVGNFTATPHRLFSLSTDFRLDNSDWEARRLDSSMRVGEVGSRYASLNYSFLDGGPREVSLNTQYDLNKDWSYRGRFRRDLTDEGKLLLARNELTYTHNCYRMSFTIQRRGFSNEDVPPSTDYLFNIELLTLGRDRD